MKRQFAFVILTGCLCKSFISVSFYTKAQHWLIATLRALVVEGLTVGVFIMIFASNILAQEDPSKYFEDQRSIKNSVLLKGVYDPWQGGYYMAIEHQAIPNMGLEYGLGLVSHKQQLWVKDLWDLDLWDLDRVFEGEKFGKVAWISARLYKFGYAERVYIGSSLLVKKGAGYFWPSFQLVHIGIQRQLIRHFVYDLNFRFGLDTFYEISENGRWLKSEFMAADISCHFQFKIGYLL
jgi:hypothetical protein